MEEIYIEDLAPYNETDHACGGGYYNCPNCGIQLYVRQSQHGDINDCNYCNTLHKMVNKL